QRPRRRLVRDRRREEGELVDDAGRTRVGEVGGRRRLVRRHVARPVLVLALLLRGRPGDLGAVVVAEDRAESGHDRRGRRATCRASPSRGGAGGDFRWARGLGGRAWAGVGSRGFTPSPLTGVSGGGGAGGGAPTRARPVGAGAGTRGGGGGATRAQATAGTAST